MKSLMKLLLPLLNLAVACVAISLSAPTAASAAVNSRSFVPITPTRILDTRQAPRSSLGHDEVRNLRLADTEAVPATAVAVSLNVTVTGPSSDGYLTVWPAGTIRPVVSNLNFVTGETVPNLVTVGLGANGAISLYDYLYSNEGSVDVIVDIVGWFAAGFNPVTPARIMDTRNGAGGITLKPGETRELSIQGEANLPNGVIGAVALNITAVNPSADGGYLTVWPTGTSRPTASSLNFVAGETAANSVIVGVGYDGKINIFNPFGSTDVIVDVAGWFDQGFDALRPFRLVDTRNMPRYRRVGPGDTLTFVPVGVEGVPASGVGAVVMNVTASNPSASGFLTVWPAGQPRPVASSVNFVAGQTIPNAVVSGVGDNGAINIYNDSGDVDVIVDITGWFTLSDNEAPRFVSVSWTPNSVDSSTSSQVITVTARITDDLSGLKSGGITFFNSTSTQSLGAGFNRANRVSGSATDGVYQALLTVPRGSALGDWAVGYAYLSDAANSLRSVSRADWESAGFPSVFRQVGSGASTDVTPPQVLSFAISQTTIDTSAADQRVTVTARITDAGSGVSLGGTVTLTGPNSVSSVFGMASLISGNSADGTYQFDVTVPRYSASGTWALSLSVSDRMGNTTSLSSSDLSSAGFPSSVSQVGAGDSQAPQLAAFSLTPGSVSTSVSSARLTFTLRATDDLSGLRSSCGSVGFSLRSPSGVQVKSVCVGPADRTSGTAVDGQYSTQVTLPYLSESGVWAVANVSLGDVAGNWRFLSSSDLAAAGFPSTFVVN